MQRVSPNTIISSSPCVRAAFIATSLLSTLSAVPQWRLESTISQLRRKELLRRGRAPLIRVVIAKLTPEPDAYPSPVSSGRLSLSRPDIIKHVDDLEENRRHCRTSYQLCVSSTQNKLKFTLTDPELKVVFRTSSGMHGYRKFNRCTYATPLRWGRDWKTRRSGFRRTARITLILDKGGKQLQTVLLSRADEIWRG